MEYSVVMFVHETIGIMKLALRSSGLDDIGLSDYRSTFAQLSVNTMPLHLHKQLW